MSNNILNLFLEACKKHPNKLAIIDAQQQITFEQLHQKIIAKANYFTQKNIQAGDRVLVFIPMSVDLYINVLALFYIGATAVFLDEWVNVKRLKLCCQLADCKGIIAGKKIFFLRFFISALRNIPVFLNPTKIANGDVTLFNAAANNSALITFTTGSTGTPKAANRTHGFLQQQFNALLPLLDANAERVDMPLLPIVLLLNLGIARTSVIANFKASKPNSFNAQKIIVQINSNHITSITTSPTYALQLAEYCKQNQVQLNLQKVIIGGAAIYPSVAKIIFKNLCSNTLLVFGSTEAEPIAHISAKNLIENYNNVTQGLCIGEVDKNANVQIIKIKTHALDAIQLQEIILPIGGIGEIIVSGKHVLDAYYKNQEAFLQNKIVDANNILWHRTGDLGFVNAENKLFLLGRCKQAIANNNNFIYPFIIENELLQIPQVQCGTVFAKNNKLIIALQTANNKPINETTLAHICQQNKIANYTIVYLQIPKDPRHNSKIDYEKLVELSLKINN